VVQFSNEIWPRFRLTQAKELKQQANQVKPFLFKEDDIDLIIKAPLYGKAFLDDYANGFEGS